MKQYDKYKPSGVEWIGDIPEHWEVIKIKYSTYVKGRVGWNGLKSSEFLQSGYSYLITGTDFKKGLVDLENCYYIDKDRYEVDPFIQLQENDLLITKDGTIGKTALVKGLDKPACLNSGIFVTRPLNNVYITPFMYWILSSYEFKKFFDYTSRGSTILHLYQNVFEDFRFTYPALTEQQQIANYLDKKTAEIDEIIADKENLIKLLEEEKEIIISNAVTKGLNPDVQMKDSGVEWIGDIPKHWDSTYLKYLADIYAGGTPSRLVQEYWQNGTIPWIASGEVNQEFITEPTEYITTQALENSSAKWIPKDSLVMALAGQGKTKGMAAYLKIDTTCNQSLSAIVPKKISSKFLFYWLKNSYSNIRKMVGDGLRDGLNLEIIGTIPVPLPKTEQEQQKIANYLDKKTDEINQTIQTIKDEIKLLKEYKEILIYEVVTGKIDVREGK